MRRSVGELQGGPGLPRWVVTHVPEDGCSHKEQPPPSPPILSLAGADPPPPRAPHCLSSSLALRGLALGGPGRGGPVPTGLVWGWGRLAGKDINEDLTVGSILQLSVGVDVGAAAQGLGRVGPQLPPGSGHRQHGSADSSPSLGSCGDGGQGQGVRCSLYLPTMGAHMVQREPRVPGGGPHRDALRPASTGG